MERFGIVRNRASTRRDVASQFEFLETFQIGSPHALGQTLRACLRDSAEDARSRPEGAAADVRANSSQRLIRI
eukprot:4851233-Pyramimonas_sp.AAC.1